MNINSNECLVWISTLLNSFVESLSVQSMLVNWVCGVSVVSTLMLLLMLLVIVPVFVVLSIVESLATEDKELFSFVSECACFFVVDSSLQWIVCDDSAIVFDSLFVCSAMVGELWVELDGDVEWDVDLWQTNWDLTDCGCFCCCCNWYCWYDTFLDCCYCKWCNWLGLRLSWFGDWVAIANIDWALSCWCMWCEGWSNWWYGKDCDCWDSVVCKFYLPMVETWYFELLIVCFLPCLLS